MKHLKIIVLALFVVFLNTANAQNTQKLGYCKTEFVVENWPKIKAAENSIITLQKQYEKQIKQKEAELQRMQQEFSELGPSMTPEMQQEKVQDYQLAETEYQIMVKKAQREIEKKTKEVLEPLMTEVFNAIRMVAEEQGFTMVINTMAAQQAYVVLYAKNETDDITLAVLEKLGVDTSLLKATYNFSVGEK